MRVKDISGGYQMWLSANDTYKWAHRAEAAWPCSCLANNRLFILVDKNGLCDITLNGQDNSDIPSDELVACVSDHLPESLHAFWPVWK